MDKRTLATALSKYTLNPFVKAGAAVGIRPPGVVVLETTGRRSGKTRRTPVGGRLENDSVWIVAEHGRRAGYVRNIEADPHVRVKVGLRWREGTGHLLPEDDPRERLRKMGLKVNALGVRAMATDLLTVRVDLQE